MKKWIFACLLLGLILAGCRRSEAEAEQLFRGDTVVNIPLHPEESVSETEAAPLEETSAPTEAVPEAPTSADPASPPKSSGGSKSSGNKSSSSSGGKAAGTTATQPPATDPSATEPPVTDPPATEPTEPPVYDISGYVPGSLEYAAADLINTYRAEAGLEALSFSETLCGVAAVRAYEAGVIWSHSRPDGSGWQTVLSDYGFGYGAAAEELGHVVSYDAATIVDKWMGSESNRVDLLGSAYTTIGVGISSVNGATVIAVILIG